MKDKIKVEIDHARYWSLAAGHPVHYGVSVMKTLRGAGVPVEGGLEFQGVGSGRLSMWNEVRDGVRFCVFEWEPGDESSGEGELW